MKLYLAGAISYDEEWASERFIIAQLALEANGHEVINPFEIQHEGDTYEAFLRRDTCEMLKCDGVAVIVDDELAQSFGAIKEISLAMDYKMPVKAVRRWLY